MEYPSTLTYLFPLREISCAFFGVASTLRRLRFQQGSIPLSPDPTGGRRAISMANAKQVHRRHCLADR